MKIIRARYAGRCRLCDNAIAPGEQIVWDGPYSVRGAVHSRCHEQRAQQRWEQAW